jgi:hypothetical protein
MAADLGTLTNAINFTSISSALLDVAKQHVLMIVTLVGVYMVLGFIKLNAELNEERAKSARVDKDGNYVSPPKKNMLEGMVADDGTLDAAMAEDDELYYQRNIEAHLHNSDPGNEEFEEDEAF